MPWAAAATIGGALLGANASKGAAADAAAAQDRANAANAYQGEIAKSQYEEYQKVYQPLEEQLVKDATNYDSQANYDKAASTAQASVNSQLGLAKQRLQRTPGLDPSSAAATTAATDLDLKGAALGASEQNKARENITNQAYARKQDAVALGKGLISNAASGLASATAGANAIASSATNSANQTASGIGGLFSSAVKEIGKADWSKLGNLFSSTTADA